MQSTPVAASGDTRDLPFMDRFDQQLQVFERGRRKHSVAEIEDVSGVTARAPKHVLSSLAYQLGRAQQHGGVQVSLYAEVAADAIPSVVQRHAPIERDKVWPRRGDRLQQPGGVRPEMDRGHAERCELVEDRAGVRKNPGLVVLQSEGADP